MKKAKHLQRFWAFLLAFVLVSTTIASDGMRIVAAEGETATEQTVSEPETTEQTSNEGGAASAGKNEQQGEAPQVEEGSQTDGNTSDGSSTPDSSSESTTEGSVVESGTETGSTEEAVGTEDTAVTEEAGTTEEGTEGTSTEATTEVGTETTNEKAVTYVVSFNVPEKAIVKVNGEIVSSTSVEDSSDLQFTVETEDGYRVKSVKAGSNELTASDGSYVLNNVTEDIMVEVEIENAALMANAEERVINVDSIVITNRDEAAELTAGDTIELAYEITPADATDKSVTWTSSDNSVATVDENGKVTAVAEGTAAITVKTADGEATDAVEVNVKNAVIAVEKVKIEGADIVSLGKKTTLKAVIMPENGKVESITWSSDNDAVAAVDENGVVTGVSEGYATITVSVNGNIRDLHEIMVVDASSEKPMHTLTIKYQYSMEAGELAGRTAAETYYIDVKEGSTYRKTSPVIQGYTASQAIVEGQMPEENLTIVVTYVPTLVKYTVLHKFENLDGTYSEEREEKEGVFGNQTEAVAKIRNGFEAGIVDNTNIGNNTVIEIEYKRSIYTIRFDSIGGNYIKAIEKPFGTILDLTTIVPEKQGYNFGGWYLDGKKITSVTVNNSVELTAQWVLKPNQIAKYSVIYWVENPEGTKYDFLYSTEQNGVVGETIKTYPAVDSSKLKNIGLEPGGFETPVMDNGKVVELDGSTVVNVKLNRKTFKVEFYLKSGWSEWNLQSNLTITAKYGEDVSAQWNDAAHSKYMWYTTSSTTTGVGAMKTMPANNIRRYGKEKDTTKIYYKTENLNGNGYSTYITGVMPSGWSINDADIIEIEGFTYEKMNTGTSTLYYTRNQYNISYNLNAVDAANKPNDQVVKFEGTFNKPSTVPTREGYRFTGWYYDTSGQSKVNFGQDKMPAHNITIYAGWEIKKYNITFDLNYDGAPNPHIAEVEYKNKVGQPASPEREGYDFLGWYTENIDGEKYDFGTPVTDAFALYAHWSPKLYTSYTVKYLDAETREELSPSVTKDHIRVGKKVSEWAVDIEGFVPDEAMKQIDLAQTGNEIIFLYSKPSPREYTVIAVFRETGEELYKDTDSTMSAAVMVSAPDLQSKGYVLEAGQDENMYVSLSKNPVENVFTFYYEKQKITYNVKYYVGGIYQPDLTETNTVVDGTAVSNVSDNCPKGYHLDKIVPEIPVIISSSNRLIEVYYVENAAITINYEARTGGSVSKASETLAPVTGIAEGSTATASAGYHFVNWTDKAGKVVNTEPAFKPEKVEGLNVEATYYANFEQDEDITITYVAEDGGKVTSNGETLAPATGVAEGSEAVANPGYHFVSWTNEAKEVVSTDVKFTPGKVNGVNVAATYYANFEEDKNITINYIARDGGSVDLDSESLAPATGVATGSTATASDGYYFVNWTNGSDEVVGTDELFVPEKVGRVNVAATYYANFAEKKRL